MRSIDRRGFGQWSMEHNNDKQGDVQQLRIFDKFLLSLGVADTVSRPLDV